MTLARTALRLCALAIFKGTEGNRPTIAEERVYDSRITDLQPQNLLADAKPTVIVLTDGEEGEQLSKQDGGPPFRLNIDLVIEICMVQAVKDDDTNEFIVGYPDTDARHEASMDFLEHQLIQQLAIGLSPMAIKFRSFARIVKKDSHRQVLDDSGVKLACRVITLTCDTNDADMQILNSAQSAPTGLDALPEPLRGVAKLLPAGSSGADVVATLAQEFIPISTGPLTGMDIDADANSANKDVANVKATVEFPQG